jgi:polyhydroxyalkanoate synthesis regulator phasin
MSKSEKDQKSAVEGWIDERIQFVLEGLTQPFEKRIARLSERIQALQKRVRRISDQLNGEEENDKGAEVQIGEEEP